MATRSWLAFKIMSVWLRASSKTMKRQSAAGGRLLPGRSFYLEPPSTRPYTLAAIGFLRFITLVLLSTPRLHWAIQTTSG